MKKIIIPIILLLIVTGCSINQKNYKKEPITKSYTCLRKEKTEDGVKLISKLVVVLDKNEHLVEQKIIMDETYKDEEQYKEYLEAKQKEYNEYLEEENKDYAWEMEIYDYKYNIISTKTYDLRSLRDDPEREYDSLFNFFNEDGTYNIKKWMEYRSNKILENSYTCGEDKE